MDLEHIKYQLSQPDLKNQLLSGESSLVPGSMINLDLEILLSIKFNPNQILRGLAWQNYRVNLNL